MMSTSAQGPDMLDIHVMSVALIGPEEQRRKAVASALAGSQANLTREFASYPELDDVPQLLETGFDVIIVELDSDPEHALDLVAAERFEFVHLRTMILRGEWMAP